MCIRDRISRARLADALRQAGLAPVLQVSATIPGLDGERLSLFEVEGFVSQQDLSLIHISEPTRPY